jgi:hypothetical protein
VKNKFENIDELFNQKLGGERSFKIPESYTNDLNNRLSLRRGKRKKRFIFFTVSLVALLGIVLVSVNYFDDSQGLSTSEVPELSKNSINDNSLEEIETGEEEETVIGDNGKNKDDGNQSNSIISGSESVAGNSMDDIETNNYSTLKDKKDTTPVYVKVTNQDKEIKQGDNLSDDKELSIKNDDITQTVDKEISVKTNDDKDNLVVEDKSVKDEIQKDEITEDKMIDISNKDLDSLVSENDTAEQDEDNLVSEKIDTSSTIEEETSENIDSINTSPTNPDVEINNDDKPKKVHVGIHAFGGVDLTAAKFTSTNSDMKSGFDQNKKMGLTGQFGAGLSLHFNKIYTGVSLSLYDYKDVSNYDSYVLNTNNLDSVATIYTDSIFQDTNTMQMDTIVLVSYDTIQYTTVDTSFSSNSVTNSYRIFALPVSLGYTFNIKSFAIRPQVSGIFELTRKTISGAYPLYNGSPTLDQFTSTKIGFSLGLDLQIQKNFNDFYVYMRPGYRMRLTQSASSINANISHRSYQALMGIGYTF